MNNTISLNSFNAWFYAIRPKTLGAIASPVFIGSAFAYSHGAFNSALMAVVLLCSLLLQILANLVNDYGDFLKGADGPNRLGPPRALQQGVISISAMQKAIAYIVVIILLLGLIIISHSGIIILFIGILSIFISIWYTLGKRPLSYLGFSEIVVLLFFGPIPALGSYYVQTMNISVDIFIASIGPAFLSTALLMTNNLRDKAEDANNNKRTLAVRFGEPFSRFMIIALLLSSLVSPLILTIFYNYNYIILSTAVALLIPLRKYRIILYEPISRRFNIMLASIGQALYIYGFIMSITLVLLSI
jgi:1,4-dihydroxy-2-naphthoate octaprenyltransferase